MSEPREKFHTGPHGYKTPWGMVDVASDTHRLSAGKTEWRFERDYSGCPWVLGVDGDPLKNQPGVNDPFWSAFYQWVQAGEHVRSDGLCYFPGAERTEP